MQYKRITARQGLIEDCAKELARSFPASSESSYRQNVWSVIDYGLAQGNTAKRKAYLARLQRKAHTSVKPIASIGLTRLYNDIARLAADYDRASRINPKPSVNKYFNSVGNPYWR